LLAHGADASIKRNVSNLEIVHDISTKLQTRSYLGTFLMLCRVVLLHRTSRLMPKLRRSSLHMLPRRRAARLPSSPPPR
jgi:hypothetical protein